MDRDPTTKAENRAYHRKLYEEACAAMEARSEAPEWLTSGQRRRQGAQAADRSRAAIAGKSYERAPAARKSTAANRTIGVP